MKIRYAIAETGQDGEPNILYHAMSDNYGRMVEKLERDSCFPETQYAILNQRDMRGLARHGYVSYDSFYSDAYHLEFDGRVLVLTESGTCEIPYLHSGGGDFETGAPDWMLDDRPLPMLRAIELEKEKLLARNESSDFCIRVCQAIAAHAGGFTSQMQWREILNAAEKDPAIARYREASRPLRVLSGLRDYERKMQYNYIPPGRAVTECQHIAARESGMEDWPGWRETLRKEALKGLDPLCTLRWEQGGLNDNLVRWCRENGHDYRSVMGELEIEADGRWSRVDYLCDGDRAQVFLLPDHEQRRSTEQGPSLSL